MGVKGTFFFKNVQGSMCQVMKGKIILLLKRTNVQGIVLATMTQKTQKTKRSEELELR